MGTEDEKKTDPSTTGSKKPLWLDVLDVTAKLLGALFLLWVAYIGNNLQARLTGISLQSQREQAESQLRANMFSNLISPIIGPKKDGEELKADREELLVDLLALNFHDDFELKPLMEDVDKKLVNEADTPESETAAAERKALWSISRRVAARQIASIQYEWETNKAHGIRGWMKGLFSSNPGCHIYTITLSKNSEPAAQTDPNQPGEATGGGDPCAVKAEFEKPFSASSPDHAYTVWMVAGHPDWANQTVRLDVSTIPEEEEKEPEPSATYQFTLTWFDLPLTDNTLLPDSNRFAVNLQGIKESDGQDSPGTVEIRVLWFPKGYFTPRERPLNFQQVRKLIGLGS